jgi:hypothetical protein
MVLLEPELGLERNAVDAAYLDDVWLAQLMHS